MIEPEPRRVGDGLRQRGDVAQSEIEALARDRMNDVRRVADQRHPLAGKTPRHRQPERKRAARADRLDLAELQAEAPLELDVKFRIGQRDDALRLARLFGPHDRGAAALQRQDRERSRRQEMLFRPAVMIALMLDGGDDAGLLVVPAEALDAARLADRRARAVGGDEQAVRSRSPSPESVASTVSPRAAMPRTASAAKFDSVGPGALRERVQPSGGFRPYARTARRARSRPQMSGRSAASRPAAGSR